MAQRCQCSDRLSALCLVAVFDAGAVIRKVDDHVGVVGSAMVGEQRLQEGLGGVPL